MKNSIRKLFSKAKDEIPLPINEPKWKFDPTDPRKFFFMHIPKTAGTTFRKMLHRQAPKNYMWPDQQFLRENGNRYPSRKQLVSDYKSELNHPILIGHYGMDLLTVLPEDVIILTFVRNPYERILSHIKHICALDNSFDGDPNKVVEEKLLDILYIQSKMLQYKPHNNKGFKKLLDNIDRIEFVGLTEEFEKSIALCNKMFGWKLEMIEPQNQRKNEILDSLSAINKNKIIMQLVPEIKAYRNVHLKFQKLCKEHNI